MRILLDTHALLWWCEGNPQMTDRAYEVISDPANELLLSLASAWEIVAKVQGGKLELPEPVETFLPSRMKHYGVGLLPITLPHLLATASLPMLHKDPFDRVLVAQSKLEGLPIVTVDQQLKQYGIETIW